MGEGCASPGRFFAIFGAVAASLVIVVNAVFLQSGAHPAPFFANPTPLPAVADSRSKLADAPARKLAEQTAPAHSAVATQPPQAVAARRYDPIVELIGPSSRIMAVQHALSEYGYGQIKPSGNLDEPTRAAIEKFEREHKLPVTGRVSDRLMSGLTAMTGHPL